MKKGLIKAAIFSAVFIIAVVLFGFAMNHTNEDLTAELKEATLPVVNFYYGDTALNELFGYTTEMDAAHMRDSITPIDVSRVLPFRIRTYGYPIDGIAYEIRSLDTKRLVSDGELDGYTAEDGQIKAQLQIQNLLNKREEYLLIVKLQSGEKTVSYYTRIMEPSDCYVQESIAFVSDFHDKTFSKAAAASLAAYVEPDASGDNSTLSRVTIHSSLDQIAWADFNGKRLSEPVISVKEINTAYNVILLNYVMASQGDGGELEYYNTQEYYRVRYTNDRMYLLNYERTMNQVFRGENDNVYQNSLQLGIRDGEIQYRSNPSGDVVCFVQEGELWSYHAGEQRLSQVFSFRSYEGMDDRENNNAHDIRIIRVDEAGSADFVVYGYMNRGEHEGEVGICLYHYNGDANSVEEKLFLPYTGSYQVLRAQLDNMVYQNSSKLYVLLEGSLYEIDLDTLKYRVIQEGLTEDSYASSGTQRYIAWLDGEDKDRGTAVTVRDLENGNEFTVQAGSGEYIRPLGFMEDDFICGLVRQSDVMENAAGGTIYPMYSVQIIDTAGDGHDVLKEYRKEGYFVSGIEVRDYTIYLNRIRYNGMAYADAAQDTIMNREADSGQPVTIGSTVTQERQTQYQLVLKSEEELVSKRLLTPKQTVLKEPRNVSIDLAGQDDGYYVYARGEVLAIRSDIVKAASLANENLGVVLDGEQQYVWKRARKAYQRALEVQVQAADASGSTIAKSLSAMLGFENKTAEVQRLLDEGRTPVEILRENMPDATVLELSGCSMDEILYYVNRGTPVFAMRSGSDAVLVTGYDATTVTTYEPALGTQQRNITEELASELAQAGNIYLAYIKQ